MKIVMQNGFLNRRKVQMLGHAKFAEREEVVGKMGYFVIVTVVIVVERIWTERNCSELE